MACAAATRSGARRPVDVRSPLRIDVELQAKNGESEPLTDLIPSRQPWRFRPVPAVRLGQGFAVAAERNGRSCTAQHCPDWDRQLSGQCGPSAAGHTAIAQGGKRKFAALSTYGSSAPKPTNPPCPARAFRCAADASLGDACYDPPRQIDGLNPLIHAFDHRYTYDALGQITPRGYLDSLQAAETPPSHIC
jgi:hypothetical protein